MSKTLVKVSLVGDHLSFRTITRARKSPHSFMIPIAMINNLCDFPTTVLCAYDCGSLARIWRDPLRERLHICFYWLHSNGSQLAGWEQTVILPFHELVCIYSIGKPEKWSCLSAEQPQHPKLVFCETKNLHAAVNDPLMRHKLSRFLRDNFHWPNSDEIRFYDDMVPYSFFFREMRNGRNGICGGVILHGQDNIQKAQYSLHT